MRSIGFPMTFSWSIGLVVAGVSNFMESAFRLSEHRGERALDERNLELVLFGGLCAGQYAGGQGVPPPRHLGFRRFNPPGLVGHTTQRHATGSVTLHDGSHRDQRESERGTVADLAIHLPAAERLWKRDRRDELAGRQSGLDLGRVTGQPMKVRDWD